MLCMKRALQLVAVFVFGVATVELAGADGEAIGLILVAGQSNAVGFDAPADEMPVDERDKQVMFWWKVGDPPPDKHDSTSGSKWTHLQAQPLGNPIKPCRDRQYGNFGQPQGGFGPEVGMARALMDAGQKELAIVKASFSGTGVRKDWNPRSTAADGACYRALISETEKAVAVAKEKGIRLRLRALVWLQGESDSGPADVGHYEDAFVEMMQSARKDLNAPNMTILLGVNTRFLEKRNRPMHTIVEAQKNTAKRIGNASYVDTSKCSIANQVHFDAKGTMEMGRMFAEQLRRIEER